MKYWTPSAVAGHPSFPSSSRDELARVYITHSITLVTFETARAFSEHVAPLETPLLIIESIDCPMRRVYSECPKYDDWARLERGGFVGTEDGFFGFMIDALH